MEKTEKELEIFFLIVGKEGNYLPVYVDLEEGKFKEKGNRPISARLFAPVGFIERVETRATFSFGSDSSLAEKRDSRLKVFQNFIEIIRKHAQESEIQKVLVRIKRDEKVEIRWEIEGEYQFLI